MLIERRHAVADAQLGLAVQGYAGKLHIRRAVGCIEEHDGRKRSVLGKTVVSKRKKEQTNEWH